MINKDFEKQAMQARLESAERQLKELISKVENKTRVPEQKILDIELHLILSTITGKPNKRIEF
ncbi:TPA: hypothetical protein ACSVZR_003901 [Bacillus cereus]